MSLRPALETGDRADVSNAMPRAAAFSIRDHLALAKNLVAIAVGLDQAKCRLAIRRRESDRRRAWPRSREIFSGTKMVPRSSSARFFGSSNQALNSALQAGVGKNPLAIDLVLQRRLLEHPRLCIKPEYFSADNRSKFAGSRFRRVRDCRLISMRSNVSGLISSSGPPGDSNLVASSTPLNDVPHGNQRRAISEQAD